jgi:multifunctional methyltransferase subunit TRM112
VSPINRELVIRTLSKINYEALVRALHQLASAGLLEDAIQLPSELPPDPLDEELVATLHKVLFDLHVVEGYLICPDTGRRFPIKDGIPNMLLHEDEI